jgi:hypothetical protein
MAILHFTGFETGSGLEDINGSVTGTGSIQSSIKRTGTYALQINPLTTGVGHFNLRKLSTGTGSHSTNFDVATTYTRFYLYIATLPAANSEEFFTARTNADGVKLALRLNSAGNVLAYDTTGTNLLATGSTVLGLGQWYRIEVQCGTGGAATYTVKIDGTQEFTGTGDLNATNNGRVTLGKRANRNGQTVDFYYDDLSVSDSAFPGAGACKVMRVSADGNYTTWTIGAGAGSDWENIDEIPPDDDTTYLLSTLVSAQASTGAFETAASAAATAAFGFGCGAGQPISIPPRIRPPARLTICSAYPATPTRRQAQRGYSPPSILLRAGLSSAARRRRLGSRPFTRRLITCPPRLPARGCRLYFAGDVRLPVKFRQVCAMEKIVNVTEPARIVYDESKFQLRYSKREDGQVMLMLEAKEADPSDAPV